MRQKRIWFQAALDGDSLFLAENAAKFAGQYDMQKDPPHHPGLCALHYVIIAGMQACIDALLPLEWKYVIKRETRLILAHNSIVVYPGTTTLHLAMLFQNDRVTHELLSKISSADVRGDSAAAMLPILPFNPQMRFLFEDEAFHEQIIRCRSFLYNIALFGRRELAELLRDTLERGIGGDALEKALSVQFRSRIDGLSIFDYAEMRVDIVLAACTESDRVLCCNALRDVAALLHV